MSGGAQIKEIKIANKKGTTNCWANFIAENIIIKHVNIKNPFGKLLFIYYILHAVDVGMTIWALNNRDNVKEGNILLSNNPSNRALLTNKLLVVPIYQKYEPTTSSGNESYYRWCYYT